MPCKTHRFRFLTLATALALAPFAFLAAVPANAQSGTLHAAPGQGLIRLKSANSFGETLVTLDTISLAGVGEEIADRESS